MTEKIVREVSKAQNAFLDWGEKHPYSKIREFEFVDGQPFKLIKPTEDGIGTELVRFDKIANGSEQTR